MQAKFTWNALNPLARALALLLHTSYGLVRMETIREMAHEREETRLLPEALKQLRGYNVATVCTSCDALISENTHHARGCVARKGPDGVKVEIRKGGVR